MTRILTIILLGVMLSIISVSLLIWLVSSANAAQLVPSVELVDGNKIPQIGLGTYRIEDQATAERIVEEAIEVGYRHIDTAFHYQNEKFIGNKLKELFAKNVIKREDIWITTKVWNTYHNRASVIKGIKLSLEALGIEQLDLALIHFPMAFKEDTGDFIPVDGDGLTLNNNVSIVETWKGMEDALKAGLTKSIGVSNFNQSQLARILRGGSVKPVVNQVEIHPYLTQEPLVNYCKSNGIEVVAYSPIAKANQTLFNEPILVEMAKKHRKSVPQVIMRWLIQRDIIVIPKTTKKERLIENFQIFDFQLSDDEMRKIFGLNKDYRITRFENARYHPDYPYEWPQPLVRDNLDKTVIRLNNGNTMPVVGLGTSRITDQEQVNYVLEAAINAGYRHIDTAFKYNNEREIGNKLRELFANNKTRREDIFITSKVWSTFHSRPKVVEGIKQSLQALDLDYLDLALVHWPMGFKEDTGESVPKHANGSTIDSDISVVETWNGMEDAYRLGLVRNIGVSNFNSEQLTRILKESQIKPVVNQVECHPYFNQQKLVDFCQTNDIQVIAYSPIRRGDADLLNEAVLREIGTKYNKTPAQIVFRCLIQRRIIIIPKTTKQERLIENIDIFDFELNEEEMQNVFALNKNLRKFTFSEAKQNNEYPFNIEF